MKRMNFKLVFVFISALVLMLSSCKKDDDEGTPSNIPTLGRDFTVTVVDNDVTFATTLSGVTWFTNTKTGKEDQTVSGEVTISLPYAGTYPFVCSNVNVDDGLTYVSDTFDVVIATTDLSFLEEDFWKALTGGIAGGKKWRLDNFMSPGGNQYNKFFTSALKYYQFTGEGDASSWNNGGHNLYSGDWTNFAAHSIVNTGPEIGTISFDGATMTATLVIDTGINVTTGALESFTSTTSVKITIQEEAFGYKTDLETLYGMTFSDEWATVSFTAPTRMPLDRGRLSVPEFTTGADGTLYNVKIISCTDSTLIVSVERVYEADGAAGPGRLLYNYICDDYTYTYDDPDAFVAPDRPTTSGTLEDGTYKLAEIPGYYYNWSTLTLGDTWATLADYTKNMAEWWVLGVAGDMIVDGVLTAEGQTRWDSAYSAYSAQTIVVSGSNITVNYKGRDFWSETTPLDLIEKTVVTTFSASGGVLTFADSISVWTPNASFEKVKELYIIPGILQTGIAIGVDNIDEGNKSYQSKLQNWIKQ